MPRQTNPQPHQPPVVDVTNNALLEANNILMNAVNINTNAVNLLTNKVDVHLATDMQYRTMTDNHDKRIRGNGEPSYDTKISSLDSRMKMIFGILGGVWGIAAIVIGLIVSKIFNDLVSLSNMLSQIPH